MIYLAPTDFRDVYSTLAERMRAAPAVEQERWQGRDVSKDPAAAVYELQNVAFEVDLEGDEDLDRWRGEIEPNLPWADDHFAERVGGEPLNPGVEWRNWPWGKSAAKFRDQDELFNHTYMERLWPKYARISPGGRLPFGDGVGGARRYPAVAYSVESRRGIGWKYGDLQDLVELLVREPSTRQAWIPLFFPEDTGYGDGGRKPCTLGYQFLCRRNCLHMWYPLRSCDLVHHFRDDCYLAVRFLLWVLKQCRDADPVYWNGIRPRTYAMHMTSLHCFENDRRNL